MTKTIRIGAAGIAMFAALGMGSAASAQTVQSADAFAEVLEPLTLAVTGSLDFGAIVVNGAGTITLDTVGTITPANCGGGNVCTGTTSAPEYTVVGTAGKDVSITLPSGNIDLVLQTDPTETMTLNNFVSSAGGTVGLNASGNGTFTVGGDLIVGATQDAGIYEGSFDVSVDYS